MLTLPAALHAGVPLLAPLTESGFQHFYNLEYDEALADFVAQAAREPDSADAHNHVANTILFRQMYRAGSLDSDLIGSANAFLHRPKLRLSAADQSQFSTSVNRAIALSSERLKHNPDQIDALYSLGVSYGIRANYNFQVRKAWIDALNDTAAARKLHTRVTDLDPGFIDARLILGIHEYVVGSLPWGWKMIGAAAGLQRDREQGIRTLKLVAEKGRMNRFDAEALLAAIYRREKRPRETIQLLTEMTRQFPRAYLMRIELADAYGDLGDRTKALDAIDEVELLKRSNAAGYQRLPEAKIHYSRGNLLFWLNDLDPALKEIQAATSNPGDLDLTTLGAAWLRLGQIYDLKGRRDQALAAYSQTKRAAPDSDAVNESKSYISSRYKR
jgi:tetratricopeptide (TPR) repeat protein